MANMYIINDFIPYGLVSTPLNKYCESENNESIIDKCLMFSELKDENDVIKEFKKLCTYFHKTYRHESKNKIKLSKNDYLSIVNYKIDIEPCQNKSFNINLEYCFDKKSITVIIHYYECDGSDDFLKDIAFIRFHDEIKSLNEKMKTFNQDMQNFINKCLKN